MNGGLIFFIVLIFLVAFSYAGWYAYARWNAKRNDLPPPSMNPIAAFRSRSSGGGGGSDGSNYPGPASGGIKGFLDTQLRKFKGKNDRSATGAYEESSHETGAAPRGRGAGSRLDPDEAWSSRVGDEAYYEEQELGMHDHNSQAPNPYGANTAYGGGGSTAYGGAAPLSASNDAAPRGRSRTRDSYDEQFDERSGQSNPFADENAASLHRGAGDDTSYHGGATVQMPSGPTRPKKAESIHSLNSPGDSRRSVFKEDM